MLSTNPIEKPRINIELCGTDTNIPPINKVKIMEENEFEQFTLEWIYACKSSLYTSVVRIGGAGDKGRDVIGYYADGTVDYYQCKHYKDPLAPSDYYLEFGKLCYYTYKAEIKVPQNYYIVASNDVGRTLMELIENPTQIPEEIIKNWDKYCKDKITKTETIVLDDEFTAYINAFDFSIISTYPIAKIIDEHIHTVYGSIRFGSESVDIEEVKAPDDHFEKEEMKYITALLEAYSDELDVQIDTVEALKAYSRFFVHFGRQRKDYYSAETIRRFVRDTLTDGKQFDVLKTEIYDGIIDVHEQDYESGYKRLVADLAQAVQINTSKSLLDSKLNCVGNSVRKGVCHMLVNDDKIRWVETDE